MKKVLVYNRSFFPNMGGSVTYSYCLSKYLKKQNFDVLLHTPYHFEPADCPECKNVPFKVDLGPKISKSLRLPFHYTKSFFGEKSWMKRNLGNFDLLHIQGPFDPHFKIPGTGYRLRPWKQFISHKKPVVSTIHYAFPTDEIVRRHVKFKNIGRLIRENAELSDIVIAPSKHLTEQLRSMGYDNVICLPNGVDLEIFNPEKEESHETFTVMCVSRIERLKGLVTLARAWKKMIDENKNADAVLKIIGQVDDADYMNLMKREIAGYEKYFELKAPSSFFEMAGQYSSSDVVVVPSRFENFPLTVLEAMAMKKPVIAANIRTIADIIKDRENGVLFEPGNASSLSGILLEFYENRGYARKIGRQGRRVVERLYDWNKIIGDVIKLYKSIL